MVESADEVFERWNERLHVAPESDLPKVVYHYTNAAGFLGILTGKCVYFTDKHFLNDRTEVRHGTDAAIAGLRSSLGKLESGADRKLLEQTCSYIEAETTERHFIFSLSERGDDLSQWRGYANDGNGYTIGFDPRHFRDASISDGPPFGFNRVSYSESQFSSMISKLTKEYSSSKDGALDQENTAQCFSATVGAAACFHKHHSFRFEREWRAVTYVYPEPEDEIHVRESGGRLIPYIEYPLCSGDSRLPILEIGIGPSVRNPNARIAVLDLCQRAQIDPKIYDAATPYVRY